MKNFHVTDFKVIAAALVRTKSMKFIHKTGTTINDLQRAFEDL